MPLIFCVPGLTSLSWHVSRPWTRSLQPPGLWPAPRRPRFMVNLGSVAIVFSISLLLFHVSRGLLQPPPRSSFTSRGVLAGTGRFGSLALPGRLGPPPFGWFADYYYHEGLRRVTPARRSALVLGPTGRFLAALRRRQSRVHRLTAPPQGLRLCGGRRRVVVSRSVLVLREEAPPPPPPSSANRGGTSPPPPPPSKGAGLWRMRESGACPSRGTMTPPAERAHRREPQLLGRALLRGAPRPRIWRRRRGPGRDAAAAAARRDLRPLIVVGDAGVAPAASRSGPCAAASRRRRSVRRRSRGRPAQRPTA